MNQNELYEAIRARLNEMFPERLELKFGCEVEVDGEVLRLATQNNSAYDAISFHAFDEIGNRRTQYCISKDNLNILGTPVALQEVLRAVLPRTLDTQPAAGLHLHLCTDNCCIDFDLTKPISEQSPDTLQAVLDIIK